MTSDSASGALGPLGSTVLSPPTQKATCQCATCHCQERTHTHTHVYARVCSPGAEASTASHIRRADSMSVLPLGDLSHPEEMAETRRQGLEPTQSDQHPDGESSRMEPERGIVDPQVGLPGTEGRGAGGRGGMLGSKDGHSGTGYFPLAPVYPFSPCLPARLSTCSEMCEKGTV